MSNRRRSVLWAAVCSTTGVRFSRACTAQGGERSGILSVGSWTSVCQYVQFIFKRGQPGRDQALEIAFRLSWRQLPPADWRVFLKLAQLSVEHFWCLLHQRGLSGTTQGRLKQFKPVESGHFQNCLFCYPFLSLSCWGTWRELQALEKQKKKRE